MGVIKALPNARAPIRFVVVENEETSHTDSLKSNFGVSMKRSVRYLLVLLLAVALTPAKAFSQQVNNKQADEALRQKAYALLESLADQIGSLQSGENRARLGSNIAGSLWAHNEPKAREMFATVTKEIRAGFVRDERDTDSGRTIANFVKLRADTALRIGFARSGVGDAFPGRDPAGEGQDWRQGTR